MKYLNFGFAGVFCSELLQSAWEVKVILKIIFRNEIVAKMWQNSNRKLKPQNSEQTDYSLAYPDILHYLS